MTTITFKGIKSGNTRIQVYYSLDFLKRELTSGHMDKDSQQFIIPRGKKEAEIVYAVSFDQDDESATLLRKLGIIPKEDDYPDRGEL